jgi:predicted amidophosphoribosyltransferase
MDGDCCVACNLRADDDMMTACEGCGRALCGYCAHSLDGEGVVCPDCYRAAVAPGKEPVARAEAAEAENAALRAEIVGYKAASYYDNARGLTGDHEAAYMAYHLGEISTEEFVARWDAYDAALAGAVPAC